MAITDDRTCNVCTILNTQPFRGNELRSFFPWHAVITSDQVLPWTHPNCRCTLLRITSLQDYLDLEGEPFKFVSNIIGELLKRERQRIAAEKAEAILGST